MSVVPRSNPDLRGRGVRRLHGRCAMRGGRSGGQVLQREVSGVLRERRLSVAAMPELPERRLRGGESRSDLRHVNDERRVYPLLQRLLP